MKPQTGIWDLLTRIVIILIVIAGILAIGSQYLPLIQQNERMRREIHRLEAELQTEHEAGRHLRAEIDLLTHDIDALEREIRAQLSLAKPGEVVFRFQARDTNVFQQLP